MKRVFIRVVIVVAIVFEMLWALGPRNGLMPRSPATVQAINAYQASPSEATKATMLEQMRRDSSRNAQHDLVLLVLMLLVDFAVIYFFWNYGNKRSAA